MRHLPPRGFTLIEALVAITIVTLAIVGPMSVANSAIVASRIARDQLTASYLTQEAVEYLHEVRDDAYLATRDSASAWTNFISSVASCYAPASCTFDPSTGVVVSASPTPLYLSGGSYTQTSGGTVTPFTRTIQLQSVVTAGVTEIKAVAVTSWSYHGRTYRVTISDHLTPWQ